MTTPKVKCKECGYEGEYNSEIFNELCQDCGEGKKCPKCGGNSVLSNKGSTCLKIIPSINWLCSRCLYEW